ncbi:PEP-CTERM sorting domain-containing protein [Accumulibacter sp.]|uniref:PEP-CTERM sorting domain-containing protein n=1 Tax=Accumulibacter sp. TaxID=2053492 RepID=UPI002619D58C|nr:PEP-CTERM sorting domain-containing protein [Accumulibacter sp.]HNI51695.1 PEP-CTERM sorting domain-containing protein [Accumulibacter sp.]
MINAKKRTFGITTTPLAAAVLVLGALAAQPSFAGVSGGWTRSSTVGDSVTNNNNGTWTYNYQVNNTSQLNGGPDREPYVVDWELPWFGDAGISNIVSPNNWAYSIETIGTPNAATGWEGVAGWQNPSDPFYAGASSPFTTVTQVLHWYSTCWTGGQQPTSALNALVAITCEFGLQDAILPGGSLAGFGFDAAFAPTGAPYQASWAFLPVRTGDPAFPLGGIPNSPSITPQAVPEPGLLALLGAGLLVAMASHRRRA